MGKPKRKFKKVICRKCDKEFKSYYEVSWRNEGARLCCNCRESNLNCSGWETRGDGNKRVPYRGSH